MCISSDLKDGENLGCLMESLEIANEFKAESARKRKKKILANNERVAPQASQSHDVQIAWCIAAEFS